MTQGPRKATTTTEIREQADLDENSNAFAAELTIWSLLERDGHLEKWDAGQVAAVRNLAAAVDVDVLNSSLWRQYREALNDLVADDSDDSADTELADLLAKVRDPKTA